MVALPGARIYYSYLFTPPYELQGLPLHLPHRGPITFLLLCSNHAHIPWPASPPTPHRSSASLPPAFVPALSAPRLIPVCPTCHLDASFQGAFRKPVLTPGPSAMPPSSQRSLTLTCPTPLHREFLVARSHVWLHDCFLRIGIVSSARFSQR